MKIRTMLIMPMVLLSIALACSSSVNPPDGIGEARMEVTQVPPGVGCLRVVVAATRSVQFDFNVSPGTNSVFSLTGIPTGRVDFSASAFPMQCPPAPGTVATWVSDPVTVMVGVGAIAQVTLSMHPNGRARVGVDFGDEPPCAPNGGACQNSSACCSTVCVSDANGNGSCAPPNGGVCAAPMVPCPGGMGDVTCVDSASDTANCGMCGTICDSSARCQMGSCLRECMPPFVTCGGACVDLTSNPSNCGACGSQCPMGMGCTDGVCGISCAPPKQVCMGPMGVFCTDVTSDANNCGGCGNACPMGSNCIMGLCVSTCAPPTVSCGALCANLQTDSHNCGACGADCGPGKCINGACLTCGAPSFICPDPMGGHCVDPTSDSSNCGGCGTLCPPNTGCINGACAAVAPGSCPAPFLLCPGPMGVVCSDRSADANNCGGCGIRCAPGSACVNGTCDGPCGPARQMCASVNGPSCTNRSTDATNCGACGAVCPPGRACLSGVCR